MISITDKTPSTVYKVYCSTRSINNYDIVSNETMILNSVKTIKTLCCIPIHINLFKTKIQNEEIPTKSFLNVFIDKSLTIQQEVSFEIETGKTLYIRLKAIGEVDDTGMLLIRDNSNNNYNKLF